MNLTRICVTISLSLLFTATCLQVSIAEEQSRELTLKECIDRALIENLSFQSSSLGLRTDELSIIQAESAFDPSLSLSINRRESETPTYFDYYKVKSIESKQTQANVTLNQNLSTGANWGFGIYNTLSESNIETEKNYTSNFGLNITQPLLQGFGKKVTRSNIYLARLTHETTRHDLENQAVMLVYEVVSAYWDLVYGWESLRVRELSIAQADSLLAYNKKGLELGVLTESDVLEAESTLLSRQQDLLNQRSQIRAAEDVLLRLLNLTSEEDMKVRILPKDTPVIKEIDVDPDRALSTALEMRPEYKIARKNLEQFELYRDLAKNSMLPRLDLNARYNVYGSGKTYNKDVRDMSDLEQYGWNVALMLSYPLRNRSARADYEKRNVGIRRANLALEDLKSQFLTEIRTCIRNVEMYREGIDVAELAVEVNELRLKMEEERFRNQLSTSYYVLQFQTDLANSRNLYNKALVDYTMAVVELQKARGTLLRDLNISIVILDN